MDMKQLFAIAQIFELIQDKNKIKNVKIDCKISSDGFQITLDSEILKFIVNAGFICLDEINKFDNTHSGAVKSLSNIIQRLEN